MTRRRWIADEVSGCRAAITGAHAHHLIRVLRVRVGQEFDVSAGLKVYRARVADIADQRVDFELEEEVTAPSSVQITLVISIIKFDRFEWAIEKCTELGVSRFVPLLAARTERHLAMAAPKRVERWRRIAREASEQSRRNSPPEIANPAKVKEAIAYSAAGRRILLSESERSTTLITVLQKDAAQRELILALGPEGGWTEAEENLFRESGWIPASLGVTVLRAETAAIAATAIASQLH